MTRRIAFGDADNNVFVAGQDGSSKRKVGAGAVGGWAPDGKRLAVAGGGLEVIDVDAGTTKQVAGRVGVDGVGFVPASWSKQGRLAFIENVGRCGGPD